MIDFTINKEEHIKIIIENFNFEKVHKVMTLLNWEWFSSDNGVPTIEELKNTAINLLNDVCTEPYDSCSMGGFKATRFDDYLELEFYISEYDSSELNYGSEYERRKFLKTRKEKMNIINKQ